MSDKAGVSLDEFVALEGNYQSDEGGICGKLGRALDGWRAAEQRIEELVRENEWLRAFVYSASNCPGVQGIAGGGLCVGCKRDAARLLMKEPTR